MNVLRLAAFSDGDGGGNPAGVVIDDALPDAAEMARIAREVGYSETAFAAPQPDGVWRVRYFSPRSEVPFCGHATIALGAALAERCGNGRFTLQLNDARITVAGRQENSLSLATLTSPPTRSQAADPALVTDLLALFGYRADDLDPAIPPGAVHAGADHLVLALRSTSLLSAMTYDLERGFELMTGAGLVTVALVYAEGARLFHVRNAFASGGVLEDPATGAAAAAFAGYLRDLGWPHGGAIDIVQGEAMGMRSVIHAEIGPEVGSPIAVSGTVRRIPAADQRQSA